ncbi:MAG: hypothetical protein HN337_06840 [Deltaproteobacteria bacterium]|jgi:hypothetical protein|nr:hypothetical protein [Deltaproteobacteria bacterium]
MTKIHSITIEKSLVARLQPLICCSESLSTCQVNDFCSSLPSQWPTMKNGREMVRLSYPGTDKSLPGIAYFTDAYIKWHSHAGCGELAKDVAKAISSSDHHLFNDAASMTNDLFSVLMSCKEQATCLTELDGAQHKLSKISESLSNRCPIMFDSDNGRPTFRDDRADDLDELAAFSQKVKEAEAGRMKWGDFFWGGGAAGVGLFALWVFYKLVKIAKSGSGKLEDFGMIISSIGANLGLATRGVRRLFGVHIVNLGRVLKYVFTGGWFRGKDMPEMVKDDNDPPVISNDNDPIINDAPKPAPPETPAVLLKIAPHADVVLVQLAALDGSQHHPQEGERFARLSSNGKRYLANLAVKRWHDETVERKQHFIADDQRLTEGKLPTSYILRFARHYLKRNSNIDIIEASASVWSQSLDSPPAQRTEPASLSEFRPTTIDVKRQLINDPNFGRASAVTRDYIAKVAIMEWESIPTENQPIFISLSDRPETGTLPQRFIRLFRKKTLKNLKIVDRKAILYHNLNNQIPELATIPFRITDKRLEQVVHLWYWLPNSIRRQFTEVANKEQGAKVKWVPTYFAEYLFKFISISSTARLPLQVSSQPWAYKDNANVIYQNYSLSRVMERIASSTEALRLYPQILKARAQTVVDAWLLLEHSIRSAFVAADDTHEMISRVELYSGIDTLPRSFVNFIHEFSTGIGILPRNSVTIKKDPDDDDGTGTPGGGGGKMPVPQTPMTGSSDMSANAMSGYNQWKAKYTEPATMHYAVPAAHHVELPISMTVANTIIPTIPSGVIQSGNMFAYGRMNAVGLGTLQPAMMMAPMMRQVSSY